MTGTDWGGGGEVWVLVYVGDNENTGDKDDVFSDGEEISSENDDVSGDRVLVGINCKDWLPPTGS